MPHYTPLTLPYFAPADQLPAPLPSFDEILSSTSELLRYPRDRRTVVRVGAHFVAKWGTRVHLLEAENMLFVQRHCRRSAVSVPRLYAAYQRQQHRRTGGGDDGGGGGAPELVAVNVIVMQHVPGPSLARHIDLLDHHQRRAVARSLRAQLGALRAIPQEARRCYYGALGHRPYRNNFWGRAPGPFAGVASYTATLFVLECPAGPSRPEIVTERDQWRRCFELVTSRKAGGGAPVFTHGDLHPGNVVLRENGEGSGSYEPFIIDWESAGWHAPFWEYAAACTELELGARWTRMARRILDDYSEEYDILNRVRGLWASRLRGRDGRAGE